MKIVLAGGTGFIGGALTSRLAANGHSVVLLTRHPDKQSATDTVRPVLWDAATPGDWTKELNGADAVINLTGEGIAGKRWTRAQKEKILHSRTQSTGAIVNALKAAEKKPGVLINASAVGYYGPVENGAVEESRPKGEGFLADTCSRWEEAALGAKDAGLRVCLLRIGVVLGPGGGALQKMVPPFQFFIGGPLGSGRQWMPWVHRDDVLGIIEYCLKERGLEGSFNATAPNPVPMKEFCRTLGRVLGRPSWAPVPGFALRLMLGEMADMLLTGQRAVPARLLAAGYAFRYPDLETALRASLE